MPSGPSVETKNPPSRLKKREVRPAWVKLASSKLPSTVCAVASCIARACCDPRQAAISLWWQPPQAALPTNVGAAAGDVGEAAPQTPIAAIAAATAETRHPIGVAATRGKPDRLGNSG